MRSRRIENNPLCIYTSSFAYGYYCHRKMSNKTLLHPCIDPMAAFDLGLGFGGLGAIQLYITYTQTNTAVGSTHWCNNISMYIL